ncbi:MAG: hypothetical protein ACXAB6_03725, partial [Candidatus Thorarchaeota archaeon]
KRFMNVEQLKRYSQAELYRRIIMTINIVDRVANIHMKFPLFDADKELEEYLLHVVEITFVA